MADPDHATCPRCGAPLATNAPTGPCPRCLVADTHGDNTEIPPISSSSQKHAHRKPILVFAIAAVLLLAGLWIGIMSARQRPDGAEVLLNHGADLHREGKLDEAIAAWREAIRLKPDFAYPYHNLGTALRAQGKRDEAIVAYRNAIRLDPSFAESHYALGLALQDQDKLREAIAAYREAIRLKSDHLQAQRTLGNALVQSGLALQAERKLEEAVAAYREAIVLTPDVGEAHYDLGNALNEQGKTEEAIAEFREAIRINPELAAAHLNLGSVLSDQGKLDEAIAAYRKVITIKSDFRGVHYNLGNALQRQGKLEEATAAYREAIRQQPEMAAAHYNLGLLVAGQGKADEAIAAWREALRLKPDIPESHSNLAWVLVLYPKRSQRDYDEALVLARKGVDFKPQEGSAYRTLALAEYRSGHWAQALAAGRWCLELENGGDVFNWFVLALAHWQQGDKDQSRKWFDKAVAWAKQKAPENIALRQLWTEAAQVLGQTGPDAAGAGETALSDSRPPAERQGASPVTVERIEFESLEQETTPGRLRERDLSR